MASIIRSSTGSSSLRASSGSRSASSSIEPFMSAKSTVTCLRSPSSAALEVRIFSAMCFGVYVAGEATCAAAEGERGAAHCPQNLCSGGLGTPHDGQTNARDAAHCPQNLIPARFSALHLGHCIPSPSNARGQFQDEKLRADAKSVRGTGQCGG